ncbi:MAG: hypothetical protein OSB21_08870 [Myxococcota bacterium]|nr:hypothetical protein [Myxococcota bacterium]
MSDQDDAYRAAVLALLLHVRKQVLDGEDPVKLRERLLSDESIDKSLLDQVWVSLRPQLVNEQENKGMRLRVLGAIWIVAGGVLAALTLSYPGIASIMVKVLTFTSIAAGVFVFQLGSRAAALATRISAMDWSLESEV